MNFISIYLLVLSLAQFIEVINIPETTTSPDARQHSAMAYNSLSGQLMIFGGSNDKYYSDLWIFDFNTFTWQFLYPGTYFPDPRSKSAAFFRDFTGEFCIFGGKNTESIFWDVWCFDPANIQWYQIKTINFPPALRIFASKFFEFEGTEYLAVVGSDIYSFDVWLFL